MVVYRFYPPTAVAFNFFYNMDYRYILLRANSMCTWSSMPPTRITLHPVVSTSNWIGGVVNKLAQGIAMPWANVLMGVQRPSPPRSIFTLYTACGRMHLN